MGLNEMATDRHFFRGHHRLLVPVLKNLREMALTAGRMFERGTGLPPKQRQKHGRSKSRQTSKLRATLSPSVVPRRRRRPSSWPSAVVNIFKNCLFPTAERSATSALPFPCVVVIDVRHYAHIELTFSYIYAVRVFSTLRVIASVSYGSTYVNIIFEFAFALVAWTTRYHRLATS